MIQTNTDLRETHIIGSNTREYIISPRMCQALSVYHMLLLGISYAYPPFGFVRLRPAMSQLLICLEGTGDVLVDGQWVRCTPGTAYLTPHGICHAYRASNEALWKVCWITYNDQSVVQPVISVDRPLLLEVEAQELVMVIEGLYHECMGQAEEAVLHQWTRLVQVYAQRILGQKQSDGRLLRLWKMVDARLAHHWSSEELAEHAGISSEHLRRLCQQQSGHSPMRHVTAMRMQRAMALLTSDSYSIAAIALSVGYENSFAFSTAFKRYVGMPPSVYRARQQMVTPSRPS